MKRTFVIAPPISRISQSSARATLDPANRSQHQVPVGLSVAIATERPHWNSGDVFATMHGC